MLKVHESLKQSTLDAHMLLQIHDELIFEAPENEIEALAELVKSDMEAALPLDVPITVDVKSGTNWHDAE